MIKDHTPSPACQLVPRPDPIPDLLPQGGIALLIAPPNVGKTCLLAQFARAFRDHTPLFGYQTNPVPAIGLVSADRAWTACGQRWFERAGYPDINYYSMTDDPTFDPRTLRRKFERTQRLTEFTDHLKLPEGGLALVDPISLFLGGNLLDYDGVAVALSEIRRAYGKRQLSAVCTAHASKQKADRKDRYLRQADQILGSAALIGFCDSTLYLASPMELESEDRYQLTWHSHRAPLVTIDLERDENGLFIPYSGGEQAKQRRVLALLPADGASITTAELEVLAGGVPVSRATLHRTLRLLRRDGKVAKRGHGSYVRLWEA